MKTILLIGQAGSGKTWVIKNLLKNGKAIKLGLIRAVLIDNLIIPGIYDNTMFEGSDKLSMAVSKDFHLLKQYALENDYNILAEGDRFMNSNFISMFEPCIIKIKDDGSFGRMLRHSSQTERQLKSLQTRISKIKANVVVDDSNQALKEIRKIIKIIE